MRAAGSGGQARLAGGSSGLQGDVCSIVTEALRLLVSRAAVCLLMQWNCSSHTVAQ